MARQARPRLRASEPPLRSELFSIEQLTRHAKALAAAHDAMEHTGRLLLVPRTSAVL